MKLKDLDKRIVIGVVIAIVILAAVAAYLVTKGPTEKDVQNGDGDINRTPLADAGPDQTIESGDMVYLDGSGSDDPDGDVLDFYWDMDDTVDDNGDGIYDNDYEYFTVNLTHYYPEPEDTRTYRVTLNVSDGELWDKSTMTVTIIVEEIKNTPIVDMSCAYQTFPGPLVSNKYTITINSISRKGEWLSNFTYNLTDSNGTVIYEGSLDNLLGAGPNATLRYLDVTNFTTVSRNDQIIVQDKSPVEEEGIFTLYYKRRNEESGSVELEKRSPLI